jgi:hypothetical protein
MHGSGAVKAAFERFRYIITDIESWYLSSTVHDLVIGWI